MFGRDANYTYMQLLAFRDGIRANDMMEGMVADLREQDMADLAVYFETQKMNTTAPIPKVLNLQQRADIEVGQSLYETLCARCHGLTGDCHMPRNLRWFAGRR